MRKLLLTTLSALTLSIVSYAADEKPTEKPAPPAPAVGSDLYTSRINVGDVSGQVTKVDGSTITIKVAQQSTTTNRSTNSRSRSTPRPTVKYVDMNYALADKVKVLTSTGKDVGVAGIQPGDYATLHITNLKSGKLGEKLDSHIEINKVTITGHNQAATATPKK